MKTITLKADEDFDQTLTQLAGLLSTSKSAVIREAVGAYKKHLDREALREKIRDVSLRARESTLEAIEDWDDTVGDGL